MSPFSPLAGAAATLGMLHGITLGLVVGAVAAGAISMGRPKP